MLEIKQEYNTVRIVRIGISVKNLCQIAMFFGQFKHTRIQMNTKKDVKENIVNIIV